jgi:hypothetical protein
MATIQWRPEVNALTTPQSYTVRYMPQKVFGYNELAAEIARDNPLWDEEMIKAVILARDKTIMKQLINGNKVTFEDAFSYSLSFHARLNEPDDPLPPVEDMLRVKVSASRAFVREVRKEARLERLPMNEKLPLITSAEDTKFKLDNVLNPGGVLRLTGSNLFFEEDAPDYGCTLTGTQSGQTEQGVFASISNSEILLVPNIPAQENPWNNEYQVSITTQYTEHGTSRTGIYRRMLRTPLALTGFGQPETIEVGILTGDATAPYVQALGATMTADETLRIQAILDLRTDRLLVSLLDMHEEGASGPEVAITADNNYSLSGFSESAVSALDIRVNNYAALKEMIRNDYSGRLVDVLEVTV